MIVFGNVTMHVPVRCLLILLDDLLEFAFERILLFAFESDLILRFF